MVARPTITEEPVERRGNKAICGGWCLCQPENHGGRGACGKAIAPVMDADGLQRVRFTARGRA